MNEKYANVYFLTMHSLYHIDFGFFLQGGLDNQPKVYRYLGAWGQSWDQPGSDVCALNPCSIVASIALNKS